MKRAESIRILLMALAGSLCCAAGDALCVAASRDVWPRAFLALATLLWACCAPLMYAMIRLSKGSFAEPAAAWDTMLAVLSVALALATGSKQTKAQWIGFGLIMLGAIVRAVGE